MVYNHLRYRGYSVLVGYIGNRGGDFVAEKDNEKMYVQVALSVDGGETRERDFGNLLKLSDNYPKYVVTRDGFEGNTYKGIRELSARQFLTNCFPIVAADKKW